MGNLQIHKTCAFVAWQGEDRGVHIGTDMLFVELLIQALQGTLRGVVVLAEVAQHDVFHARMIDLRHKTRRLLIAQMAERTRDALLQDVGIRAFLQHFHIVIGLNDEVVGPANLLLHHLVEHPYIGGNGQGMSFIIKMISHSPSPIMHHRESLNRDTTQLERLHGLDFVEETGVDILRGFAFNKTLQTIGVGINRDGVILGQHFQAFHMIDMVVGDQDGLDVADAQVVLSQPSNDLLCANAHIDDDPFFLLAHIIAIAAAARGKAAKDERRKAGEKIHQSQIWPQK